MRRRKRSLDDFSAEIDAHLQLEADRLRDSGLSDDEARAAARRAFGNVLQSEERFYERQFWGWWVRLRQDVRYGVRLLTRAPGFAAITVLTMAVGIGATTALFSVVDATLLRPLPYSEPGQLVRIEDDLPGADARNVGMSVPEWQDFERSGVFAQVSPIGGGDVNLTGSAHPERVAFLLVSPNYFDLLRVAPEIGHAFDSTNRSSGFTLEALISEGLWKRSFGADPRIVGRVLRLDNDAYRVVGVVPASFHDPGRTAAERQTEIWLSAGFTGPPFPPPLRSRRLVQTAIARLAPGLTVEAAQGRVDALVTSLRTRFPDAYPVDSAWTVRLVPLKDSVVAGVRPSLWLLFGAVVLVLLIACANVANLLLARASTRQREMALRQALGAAPMRLFTQLLTESLLLSVVGGMLGLVVLSCTRLSLLQLLPDSLPQLNEITIRWPVFWFALGASLIAGVGFGLVPAVRASRRDPASVLGQAERGSTAQVDHSRRWLVIGEVGLSLTLTVAAGLLLRSFVDLLNAPLGFSPANVVTARTWLPVPNDPDTDIYRTAHQESQLLREVLRRANALPGVGLAAIGDVSSIPLGHSWRNVNRLPFAAESRAEKRSQDPLVDVSRVTPQYFALLGMRLVRGRLLSDDDVETTPRVAVVNEAFARMYWPAEVPIGQRFTLPAPGDPSASQWIVVVGVVADARTETIETFGAPHLYLSLYQRRANDLTIFLRGAVDSAVVPHELETLIQSINPDLPVFGAQSLDDIVSAARAERRFSMQIVGVFALTTLCLAGLGVYGVISYLVSARAREIRIRRALGAQSRDVFALVLRHGMGLALAGTAVGLLAGLAVSHLMAEQLYGVRPTDPLTFGVVALLLLGIALVACYGPARRAVRIDALVALGRE